MILKLLDFKFVSCVNYFLIQICWKSVEKNLLFLFDVFSLGSNQIFHGTPFGSKQRYSYRRNIETRKEPKSDEQIKLKYAI